MRKLFLALVPVIILCTFFAFHFPQKACADNNICSINEPQGNTWCSPGFTCYGNGTSSCFSCPAGYADSGTTCYTGNTGQYGECCAPCALTIGAACQPGATDPALCCSGTLVCTQTNNPTTGRTTTSYQCVSPSSFTCPSSQGVGASCTVGGTTPTTCCAAPLSCEVTGQSLQGHCAAPNPTAVPTTAACIQSGASGCTAEADPQGDCCNGLICTGTPNSTGAISNGKCTAAPTETPTPAPPPPPCQKDAQGNCMSVATGFGNVSIDVASAISALFAILLSFSGGIILIIIIIAGYRLMTSQGDPEKIKTAREMLTAGIIGLLFVIFSVTILRIIGVDILHIPGLGFQ